MTRDMPIYPEGPQPGPEVYSLQAADIKIGLDTKGQHTQSTVNMGLRKGERVSTFLWDKQKSDYDQNYHD